jgi:hypothetical protein
MSGHRRNLTTGGAPSSRGRREFFGRRIGKLGSGERSTFPTLDREFAHESEDEPHVRRVGWNSATRATPKSNGSACPPRRPAGGPRRRQSGRRYRRRLISRPGPQTLLRALLATLDHTPCARVRERQEISDGLSPPTSLRPEDGFNVSARETCHASGSRINEQLQSSLRPPSDDPDNRPAGGCCGRSVRARRGHWRPTRGVRTYDGRGWASTLEPTRENPERGGHTVGFPGATCT